MNNLVWHRLNMEIPDGDFIIPINIAGKKVCLLRHSAEVFAVQNTCPHAGGILSGGTCKNGYLICPIHRWEYNLKTGRGAEGQGDYIDTYPLNMRSDGLYIGFKESWIKRLFRK